MIRTVCFNPAVDRTYHIEKFLPGQKYFGNKPVISAGGKGINVARAVASLGRNAEVWGFIAGANGEIIRKGVEESGCLSRWIDIPGETRVTVNIIDKSTGNIVAEIDPKHFRPAEVDLLIGDPSKAKANLGWSPKVELPELVKMMVEEDLKIAKQDMHLETAGFQVNIPHE